MSRSLNKATLIGNLTRDPELRYTPQGTAVCTFSVATNRQWKTESGEPKDEAEFHRIVAWDKLAEICAQMLAKGKKVYVEGRIQTRKWTGQDGQQRTTTEIVISDMLLLDRGREVSSDMPQPAEETEIEVPEDFGESTPTAQTASPKRKSADKKSKKVKTKTKTTKAEDDEIPF
jgi:single-strand DNA-binding protein